MLIDFEGIDGSGKATQATALANRINVAAREDPTQLTSALLSFPAYSHTMFGPIIKQYLRGEFGDINAVDPLMVSLLYALDRREMLPKLRGYIAQARHVVCDRYVSSNIAHQCSKLAKQSPDNWRHLADQIEAVEYDLLKLPRADMVFYLDLTAEQSYVRTHARDTEKDIHQDDIDYLWWVREVYLEYAHNDESWHLIQCFDGERPRTIDEIKQEIWEIFKAQYSQE